MEYNGLRIQNPACDISLSLVQDFFISWRNYYCGYSQNIAEEVDIYVFSNA